MDPNACASALKAAIASGDWAEAAELAASLRTWTRRGGFWPTNLGRSEVEWLMRVGESAVTTRDSR